MSSAISPFTERACCHRTTLAHEAAFCGECGKPAVRCMAHSECGGLLDVGDLCQVCVWPEVVLDASAMREAQRGGVMTLPLKLKNASTVGLPLFVTGVYSREGRGEWQAEPQSWERLDSGREATVIVRAEDLERVGPHRVEVLFTVATRWRWREERYAFVTSVDFTVGEPPKENGHNINVSGDNVGPTTVYISQSSSTSPLLSSGLPEQDVELDLVRADIVEREMGLRGDSKGVYTPKSVRLCFDGFADGEAPKMSLLDGDSGLLSFGRLRARPAGGTGDIRMLVRGANGETDEDRSLQISRQHFHLYIESGRVMVRVNSEAGMTLNGERQSRGAVREINDGAVIHPLVKDPAALSLTFRFDIHNGVTDEITISAKNAQSRG
ncbi:MAG: FHA domain-containing protein [Hyphomonadaceae bacterium]|nr:FHA domain-containing protein [Hyphomonadaceae bacterium]